MCRGHGSRFDSFILIRLFIPCPTFIRIVHMIINRQMKHYHLFFILCCSWYCICANAQPNERLRELEQTLKEQGFGLSHIQRSGRGIEHRWMSTMYLSGEAPRISHELWQKMSKSDLQAFKQRIDSMEAVRQQRVGEAITTIRSTLSNLAAEASESYMYEVHHQDCDTIRLSMAWRDGDLALTSWRGDGGVHYSNAREAVSFQYERPSGQKDGRGHYTHIYTDPYPEPMGDIKSFDGEAFQAVLSPCLKRLLKLKGSKKYPVYWRHDEGYEESVGDKLIYKVTLQSDYGDNKHTGLTTGDLYFIPKTYESEALELLATLDSLSHDYVEGHYDQDYTYHFNPQFSYGNAVPIVSGSNWPDKQPISTEHALYASRDENGFYILLIKTEGELWMPRDFTKLKSWINGEQTYFKGMKPKDSL